mgnify:CR=1 FL=1
MAAANTGRVFQFKLVLLGDSAVGKSSLVLRFVRGQFFEYQESTIGAAFLTQTVALNDTTVKFEIWDTAGQERYHSLAPMYYRGAAAAILVYDMTKKSSFEKLQKWVDELKERGPEGIVLCVAANKCDLEEGREVEVAEGAEFAQKSGADFFETSAKNDENVGRIFTTLVTNVQRKSEAARPAGEARLDAAPPKKTSCCG